MKTNILLLVAMIFCLQGKLIAQSTGGTASTAIEICNFGLISIPQTPYLQRPGMASCFPDDTYAGHGVWFTWTATESMTLEFEIMPMHIDDDLDFIVFEQNNNLKEVRCMASGTHLGQNDSRGTKCLGNTGLRNRSLDKEESNGCHDASDNFLMPLDLEIHKTYYLLVLNYDSDRGFRLNMQPKNAQLSEVLDLRRFPYDQVVFVSHSIDGDLSFDVASLNEQSLGLGCNLRKAQIEKNEISISPNPIRDQSTIAIYSKEQSSKKLQIFNSQGRLISASYIELQAGWNELNMSFKDLENGAYYIKVIGYEELQFIKL